MAQKSEKVTILIMRDGGDSRRMRVRRWVLRWCIVLFCVAPCLAIAGIGISLTFWLERGIMQDQIDLLERRYENTRARAGRLATLEELLKRDASMESQIFNNVQNTDLDDDNAHKKQTQKDVASVVKKAAQEEGPGHAVFPVTDTGHVGMGNVQVRLLPQNRIRTALDLRNLNPPHSITGEIFCILSLADGKTIPLTLTPDNVGFFKIQNWKRAVLFAHLEEDYDLTNAQMLIEVKTDDNTLIYRNIYAIEQ